MLKLMKITYLQMFFLASIACLMMQCTPQPLPPAAPFPTPPPFTFVAKGQPVGYSTTFASIAAGAITIVGTDGAGGQLAITLNNQTSFQTGSYPLLRENTGQAPVNQAIYIAAAGENYSSFTSGNLPDGTVTITSVNTTTQRISGIFNFYGYNAWNGSNTHVNNGAFNDVPYTTTPQFLPLGSNSFTCKIDGNNFVANAIQGSTGTVPGTIALVGSYTDAAKGEMIAITIPSNIIPGTYDLKYGFGVDHTIRYDYTSGTTQNVYVPDNGQPGTLVIQSHDPVAKKIKGTFSVLNIFSAQLSSNLHLTNGAFDITYQ
ncbi:MAG: DUF6252 family protein [Bacteroidia bacterium]